MTYPNDETYEGEWLNSERSGKGTHNFHNGDKYEGQWRNDKPNGRGKKE